MVRVAAVMLSVFALSACAGTSYGVSTDGTFPPRIGGDYPNWEHICVVFDSSNATDLLTQSGEQGFELVGIGLQGSDSLMCFKRPKR